MITLAEVQNLIHSNLHETKCLMDAAGAALDGCTLIINRANFNGQPYGRSRKSAKGRSWIFKDGDWLVTDHEGYLVVAPPFGGCERFRGTGKFESPQPTKRKKVTK